MPTPAALRFVGRPTLEAISRNPVETDLYEGVAEVRHVALGHLDPDLLAVDDSEAHQARHLAAFVAHCHTRGEVLARVMGRICHVDRAGVAEVVSRDFR